MAKEVSCKLIKNYLLDFLKINFQKDPVLNPFFFTYYITLYCNFNCAYCGFAQSRQTTKFHKQLNTEDVIKLMKIIKKEIPYIYLTGGEPLLRKDIITVCKSCKDLAFKSISVNTNMSLIHNKMEILDYLTNLVASFDVLDEKKNSEIIGMPLSVARQVKENIIECAKLQKRKKFLMTVNCVVTSETIFDAREVMNFCFEHNIRFAIVPAEPSNRKINCDLKDNKDYQKLIKDIIKKKKQGKLVFGSLKYLNTIYDFKSFDCYPTLTPHIYPEGDLLYPCQALSKRAGNLLKSGFYKKILKDGIERYGALPMCKNMCYKACYIEPSNFIKNPFSVIKEFL